MKATNRKCPLCEVKYSRPHYKVHNLPNRNQIVKALSYMSSTTRCMACQARYRHPHDTATHMLQNHPNETKDLVEAVASVKSEKAVKVIKVSPGTTFKKVEQNPWVQFIDAMNEFAKEKLIVPMNIMGQQLMQYKKETEELKRSKGLLMAENRRLQEMIDRYQKAKQETTFWDAMKDR